MIESIITFISSVLEIILLPIDLLITALLPDLANTFASIYAFFEIIFSNIGFAIDLLAVPPAVISLMIIFFTFKLTLPIQVYMFKLVLNWYDKIKG